MRNFIVGGLIGLASAVAVSAYVIWPHQGYGSGPSVAAAVSRLADELAR